MDEASNSKPETNTTTDNSHTTRIFLAIPARLCSTRLPEKPLQDLCGKPMISRVAERALKFAEDLQRAPQIGNVSVLVATDDTRIANAVKRLGAQAAITSPELRSGTDRIFAALEPLHLNEDDLVINIQGDEPFFSYEDVFALIQKMLESPTIPMGTLAFSRTSAAHFFRSSVVKVIADANMRAIYFTRAPAPWPRSLLGASGNEWMKSDLTNTTIQPFLHHLGVYAYRWKALREFSRNLPQSHLENLEGLEQLRAVEAGWHIILALAKEEPFGIDTPEDLAQANQIMFQKQNILHEKEKNS